MPATEEDLFARLSELGIETETVRHPAVFTVEESKALRGDLPGGHTKNLFLKDKKGALWLVVALEDRPVDMKDLRRRIGSAPLSFGRPELLKEVLGIDPGSVTPFAVINDTENRVNVVLDAVTPEGLVAFIRSCGHEPAVVAL
jgi:Ala-tRNA(Pro) deacylase